MRVCSWRDWRQRLALAGLLVIISLQLVRLTSYAQNLGQQPATGQAVQGQTAAQPEGAVLNLVNWVGNVIAPVGEALAVVLGVVAYSQGRGVARWAITAGGLLVISGLTRWVAGGVSSQTESRAASLRPRSTRVPHSRFRPRGAEAVGQLLDTVPVLRTTRERQERR
jgi:hypothetical protein